MNKSPRLFARLLEQTQITHRSLSMATSVRSTVSSHQLGLVAAGFSGGQVSIYEDVRLQAISLSNEHTPHITFFLQRKAGVDIGPTAILESGLLDQLKDELGYNVFFDGKVHNYRDLSPPSDPDYRGMKRPQTVSAVTRKISSQVYEHARAGQLVLTLGGDHSIAIGTVSGVAQATRERLSREPALIYVDAHADINTPETSNSGNIHGMPLAFLGGLARDDPDRPFGWLGDEHRVNLGNKLVYIGLRSLDTSEKKTIRELNIKAFSMDDVDRYGIGKVIEMALEYIGKETPIHMSFDIDALDPMWAASTGVPEPSGLTLREAEFIARSIYGTGNLVALDLVEVNPSIAADKVERTIQTAVSVVRCALGDTLL